MIAPFGLVYLFNWFLFLIVFISLLKKSFQKKEIQSVNEKLNTRRALLKRHFITAVCLSLLFGLGWGFGLLATNAIEVVVVRTIFQALFIFFVSLQGFMIFVLQCLRSSDARNEWKRWLMFLTCKKVTFIVSTATTSSRVGCTPKLQFGNSNSQPVGRYSYSASGSQSDTLQKLFSQSEAGSPVTLATEAYDVASSPDSVAMETTHVSNGSLKKELINGNHVTDNEKNGLVQIKTHPSFKVTAV